MGNLRSVPVQTNISGVYIPKTGMTTLNVNSNTIGYLGILAATAAIWCIIRRYLRRGQLLHSWTSITNTNATRSYQEDVDRQGANAKEPTQTSTTSQPPFLHMVKVNLSPETGGRDKIPYGRKKQQPQHQYAIL